jgi:hypothetical protein
LLSVDSVIRGVFPARQSVARPRHLASPGEARAAPGVKVFVGNDPL